MTTLADTTATPDVPPEPESAAGEQSESVADHAAAFNPNRKQLAADDDPPEAGARDAQGRFKNRHRAKSQVASPDDAPRIQELTKRLRETETERDALKARTAQAQPIAPSQPAPQSQSAQQPAQPIAGAPLSDLKKPKPEEFDDYDKYLDARDAYNRETWERQERVKQDNQRIVSSWVSRVDEAKADLPDFEAVALKAPTKIKPGSLIDAWILESTAGPRILYALQKDEAELQRIEALSPVQQAEALALLGQRVSSTARPLAASTGSAETPPRSAVPRPPNPVRTGPIRTGELPGDDASIADHAKVWGPRRH